jgi:hypothetical protein
LNKVMDSVYDSDGYEEEVTSVILWKSNPFYTIYF